MSFPPACEYCRPAKYRPSPRLRGEARRGVHGPFPSTREDCVIYGVDRALTKVRMPS